MADIKLGEPFGMDLSKVSSEDWALAVQRVIHDLRSDFIYAPHIGFIYRKASEELVEIVKRELRDGQHKPGLPRPCCTYQ